MLIVSTWKFGQPANQAGWRVLAEGGTALDAVVAAATVTEDDPEEMSVGYGGRPNADGVIQLDAAVIDGPTGRMGAVAALEGIRHPTAVARKVMEAGKHILLAGDGARRFALSKGFAEENLATVKCMEWYARQLKECDSTGAPGGPWGANADADPDPDPDADPDEARPSGDDAGHDTIGVLAIDGKGDTAAACTTSGTGMKWAGRVGDTPLIGAGIYLDGEVGGAVGTGQGERAIEICGSFAVVELMRGGASPQEACEEVICRTARRHGISPDSDPSDGRPFQFAYLALRPDGAIGAAAMKTGFSYAVRDASRDELVPGPIYGRDFG